jgi:putative ABC transport system permease protein
MVALIDDVRFGARVFRRRPGLSGVVVATLALGIATATLVFSLVNAILYRIYDRYPEPGRLVLLQEENPRLGSRALTSTRSIGEWHGAARSFAQVGGLEARRATLTGRGEPRSLFRLAVTEDALPMLGADVTVGRPFAADEYRAASSGVVLLGHRLGQDWGLSPALVGQSIVLDGQARTVVGVLGPKFTVLPFFGNEPDIVTPLPAGNIGNRADRTVLAIARLREAVSLDEASAEMKTLAAAAAQSDPAARDWQVSVRPARGLDLKGDAGFIVVLTVGVGFVLLIVCVNVTNLLLSRAVERTREIATRLALGATPARLGRQLVIETAMLAAAGGASGLLLAFWACRAVSWLLTGSNLSLLDFSLDARTAAFAVVLSAASAIASGAVPAARGARTSVVDGLKEGQSALGTTSPGRLRRLLVGVEVTLAVVLLVGSGLVLKGLVALRGNDPGFRPDGLLVSTVTLGGERYVRAQAKADYAASALELLDRHREISSAVSSFVPAIGGELSREAIEIDARPPGSDVSPAAGVIGVSPTFFGIMGIPLKAGRVFDPRDGEHGLPVAIVDEQTVTRWFAGRSPLGRLIIVRGDARTVVGVVGSVRAFHLNVAPAPVVYVPFAQEPTASLAIVVRAGGDPRVRAALVRSELQSIDREQVIRGGDTYRALIGRSLGGFDMTAMVVGVIAVVALGLAASGLYSVMAFWVACRTREIAIRMALGASPWRVIRELVAGGLRLALWGGAAGAVLSLAAGKLLSFRLHQVRAFDPAILAAACLLVLAVAGIASYLPARRAALVDPNAAIRAE